MMPDGVVIMLEKIFLSVLKAGEEFEMCRGSFVEGSNKRCYHTALL